MPVRSHPSRIVGCWRRRGGSCSPQSYPGGGEGGSRVGGRTCPGMHCRLFPGSHSCQTPVSPPGHKASSAMLFADLTLGWPAAPVVGGAGDTNRRLHAAAATRGKGLGASAGTAELHPPAPHSWLHLWGCICGAALRKHKTRSNIRPRYAAVLRFDVKVRIKNHFCPARRSDGLARFCARLHHVSPRIDRVRWWVPH